MKLVQDLPEIFEEFGEKRREAFLEVKEYVQSRSAYSLFRMKQLRQQSVNFLRVCVHL